MSFNFGKIFKIPDTKKMYSDMAEGLPDFVTCSICGFTKKVNVGECLRKGWPQHCSKTMYLGELPKENIC